MLSSYVVLSLCQFQVLGFIKLKAKNLCLFTRGQSSNFYLTDVFKTHGNPSGASKASRSCTMPCLCEPSAKSLPCGGAGDMWSAGLPLPGDGLMGPKSLRSRLQPISGVRLIAAHWCSRPVASWSWVAWECKWGRSSGRSSG